MAPVCGFILQGLLDSSIRWNGCVLKCCADFASEIVNISNLGQRCIFYLTFDYNLYTLLHNFGYYLCKLSSLEVNIGYSQPLF